MFMAQLLSFRVCMIFFEETSLKCGWRYVLSIHLKGGKSFVFFEFTGDGGHLNRYGYPSDFDEIRELLNGKGYYSTEVVSGWEFNKRKA